MRRFTPDELAEIRDSYRNAANAKKQIGILADLYACSTQDIQLALGLPVFKRKPRSAPIPSEKSETKSRVYRPWTCEQINQLIALYEQDLTSRQIAEQMGRSRQSVRDRLCVLRKQGVVQARHRPTRNKESTAAELERLCDVLRELINQLHALLEKGGGA